MGAVVKHPTVILNACMFSHCVYIWKHSGEVMYVGRSANGIRRLGNHGVLPTEFTDDDLVEIFLCRDELSAGLMEHDFIATLHPKLNRKQAARREWRPKVKFATAAQPALATP